MKIILFVIIGVFIANANAYSPCIDVGYTYKSHENGIYYNHTSESIGLDYGSLENALFIDAQYTHSKPTLRMEYVGYQYPVECNVVHKIPTPNTLVLLFIGIGILLYIKRN